LKSPHPFVPPFALLANESVDYYICRPETRGVPITGSLIYAAEASDISKKAKEFWEVEDLN